MEVANSARSYGYGHSADCPISWLKKDQCDTLADLTDALPYTINNITLAPWYDPDRDDVSRRFYGAALLSIDGVEDSTRSAALIERVGDGGKITGYRHGSREIRVRTFLTAKGLDALSYGMMWMRQSLEPGSCGMHDTECGLADMGYFIDCPPKRGYHDTYTDWTSQRSNRVLNPNFEVNTTNWSAGNGGGVSRDTSLFHSGIASLRLTVGLNPPFYATTNVSTASGAVYTASAWVYSTVARNVQIVASPGGSGTVTAIAANTWTRVSATFTASSLTTAIQVTALTGTAALNIDDVLVESSADVNDYFDGDSIAPPPPAEVPDPISRYRWAGTASNSVSIYETRQWTPVPYTNEEYADQVEPWVRHLHDVACISGPMVTQEMKSSDGMHFGYVVEFTLQAENPFIYSKNKATDLGQPTTAVIQDVTYNLMPYPSMELSSGTVEVARNYAANPSVETDASSWATYVDGTAILTGNVVGSRSTSLASVGTASYRVAFTAPSAGTNGLFGGQQEVTIPDATLRYSINIWASAASGGGTSSITNLRYFAYWRAAGSTLRTDDLGTQPAGGGPVSVASILPPSGATSVIVRAYATMASWALGAVVYVYLDALNVSNP